jgi:hypothetical protein
MSASSGQRRFGPDCVFGAKAVWLDQKKEDVDLSGLRTGVVGDGFGDVEGGIFAALATASPSNSGHVVDAYLAKTMWRH